MNSDDLFLTVVDTGGSFAITTPNAVTDSWTGGAAETISWNVAGTDGNGIDVATVNILLSTDGGLTFPFLLATTANDGSHSVTAPNINTSNARIKVESVGNVFFDISDANFTIASNPSVPGVTLTESGGATRVDEGGAADTYDISLNTDPAGDVTILVSADAESEISTDGTNFASTQTLIFNSTAPQTITVRAIDDTVEEGAHTSVISHAVTVSTSGTYPVGTLIDNLIVHITDDELPPVVGIDFDLAGRPSPTDWAQQLFFSSGNPVNMTRDDGVATPFDLTFALGGGSLSASSAGVGNESNIPRHDPIINEIGGFSTFSAAVTATWSDLTPGTSYGVFVFGLGTSSYSQSISIAGATTLPSFDQVLVDGVLQVNDEGGSNTRTLKSYQEIAVADASGNIAITVTPNSGSAGVALGGLAIREIPQPAIAAGLTVTINSDSISENGGTTTATVSRNSDTTNALVVNLSSNDTGEATVPATVTIAAGQTTSPPFTISGVNDAIVDGTQTVTVTATAAAHTDGTDTVDVTDNDIAALTVTIVDASISENGGSTTATVSRNTDTTGALVVNLSSNDTGEATVPATVTIAVGQTTSSPFTISGVNDAIIDGTQTVTVTATAAAHADGTDTVDVTDDDVPLDFGDAPSAAESGFASSYPVTLTEDGARHGAAGATLGPVRDLEADGTHSANADADDTTGSSDDEDGVRFTGTIKVSDASASTGSVVVDLQNAATANLLDAWIDFNRDGDWDDSGEQIFTSFDLGGTNGRGRLTSPCPRIRAATSTRVWEPSDMPGPDLRKTMAQIRGG